MFDVIILGCGVIGALKDNKYDSVEKQTALTWASAFNLLKDRFDIRLFFIDINEKKAQLSAKKWSGTFHSTISDYETYKDDRRKSIYIVATPPETHKDVLVKIKDYNPTLVIVEKPFCKDLTETLYIKEIYKIPIMVDYSRRFLPITYVTKQMINADFLGKIQQCRVIYTRGFKRDASHAIDLINYFFGKCTNATILNQYNSIIDYDLSDPTYSAYLTYEKCPEVFITGCNGDYFDIFEIDIIGEKSRHTFVDHGKKLVVHNILPEPTYGDYKTLVEAVSHISPTHLTRVLFYAAQNALEYVANEGKTSLLCTIDDAINVHKVFKLLGV